MNERSGRASPRRWSRDSYKTGFILKVRGKPLGHVYPTSGGWTFYAVDGRSPEAAGEEPWSCADAAKRALLDHVKRADLESHVLACAKRRPASARSALTAIRRTRSA